MSKPVVVRHDGDDCAVVGARMRVLIEPAKEGGYVAQGLELDYVATGKTVEEVQQRFADGIVRTIRVLVSRGKSLSALFKSSAPRDAWDRYLSQETGDVFTCATVIDLPNVAESALPYRSIAFLQHSAAA